ncbi:hypothetical protein BDM02DRAFT_1445429 [Thelephora ganbajun]|uniref:Uncharacterized protein n=1 Tax=Thelephora ganbajun TaxID=370292 RepID=A0ACB6Z186_THEGA|nr:hypothetical protein BDM02DRAFT_1445429 [Thelephora ganbajun]
MVDAKPSLDATIVEDGQGDENPTFSYSGCLRQPTREASVYIAVISKGFHSPLYLDRNDSNFITKPSFRLLQLPSEQSSIGRWSCLNKEKWGFQSVIDHASTRSLKRSPIQFWHQRRRVGIQRARVALPRWRILLMYEKHCKDTSRPIGPLMILAPTAILTCPRDRYNPSDLSRGGNATSEALCRKSPVIGHLLSQSEPCLLCLYSREENATF